MGAGKLMEDIIKTNRLKLRQVSSADLADLFDYASQPTVAAAAGFDCCQTFEQAKRFMKDLAVPETWVLELISSQRVIGNICLFITSNALGEPDLRKRLLGYALNQDYWNLGYMTEALQGVAVWATQKKVKEIGAVVSIDNIASQRVLEKNQFVMQSAFKAPLGTELKLQPVIYYQKNVTEVF
jgi:RimJ/RimL family protein N-acetyltransferase